MQLRRYKIGPEEEPEERIVLPADLGIAKILKDAYNEQVDIIFVELPYLVRDMDLIEDCMKDLDCRIQVHRIAYETAVEILHHLVDKVAAELWQLFINEIKRLEAEDRNIM